MKPKNASMYFMSIILNRKKDIFSWYSLQNYKDSYNPWKIPYRASSNIRIPHWNRTMSMFLKLYVIAVYKGFKAAWFGWLNNSYAIYGDLAYDSVISSRVAAKILNVPLLSSIHDDPICRFNLKIKSRWLGHLYENSFRKTLQYSSKVAVISDYMGEYYKTKYGVKTQTLFIGSQIEKKINESALDENSFIIGSIGSFHSLKNLDLLLDAIALLNKESGDINYKILHIGKFPERYSKLKFLEQTGYLGDSEFKSAIRRMKIGLLNWSFDDKFRTIAQTSLPLKIHNYLSFSMPILSLGPPNSSIDKFVNENQCGTSCTINNPYILSASIKKLSNPKIIQEYKLGVQNAYKKYSRKKFFKEFESFINLN